MIPAFAAAATAIVRALGEDAVYTALSPAATFALRAVVGRDTMTPVAGMMGGLLERRTAITVRSADLAGRVPALGDTVAVGAETWKVLAIDQDDGYLVRLNVRKQR